MNRYPLWKYAILVVALLVGLVYTAPNFFGEAPAVQVSSGKATLKLDAAFAPRVQQLLEQAGLKPDFVQFDGNSVKARLADTEAQIKAKDVLSRGAEPGPGQPELHRRAEPAVALAGMADGAARVADVPGPGPARRRALPDAGGHEGGADQEGRSR